MNVNRSVGKKTERGIVTIGFSPSVAIKMHINIPTVKTRERTIPASNAVIPSAAATFVKYSTPITIMIIEKDGDLGI